MLVTRTPRVKTLYTLSDLVEESSVSATVHFFAAARAAAGVSATQVEPGTLSSVANCLTEEFPELKTVLPRCSYLIDGVAVHGDPAKTVIPPGCRVDVLPPFAGG